MSSETTTIRDVQAVVDAYFDGINAERYDDVGRLFAPDAVLIAPGIRPRRGPDAIAAYFRMALARYPVHHDGPGRVVIDGSTAFVEIAFTGALASGAPMAFDAIDVFDLDEHGLITRLVSLYDSHLVRTLLAKAEAVGAAPALPAMPDKALVALVSALPGEEAEFNTWYAQHMREVAEVPGIRPGTRYRMSEVQAQGAAAAENDYLAIYEIDGDIGAVLDELVRRRAGGEWTPRRGIDDATIKMWAFERITADGRTVNG